MLNFTENLARNLAASYAAWRQRRRAYIELAALDDRALADIGISRSEIRYVLSQSDAAPARPGASASRANSDLQHA